MMRVCGDCQLCCKLLPTKEIGKPANTRCKHQKVGKGCVIYATRPFSCRHWRCRWLIGDDTADLARPDRAHLVIDIMPDYVTAVDPISGRRQDHPVLQVWTDPAFPDAHRDPHFRAYVARQGEEHGMAALIRCGSLDGFLLVPPALNKGGEWIEIRTAMREEEHTLADFASRFNTRIVMEE